MPNPTLAELSGGAVLHTWVDLLLYAQGTRWKSAHW